MNKVNLWNWKYEIALDREVQSEITRFISNLDKEEAHVYNDIVKAFKSCFSMSELLDLVVAKPEHKDEYINIAYNNLYRLMGTPDVIYDDLFEKIERINDKRLFNLLNESMRHKIHYNAEEQFLAMFGQSIYDIYKDIMKYNSEPVPVNHGTKIMNGDLQSLFNTFYNEITSNKLFIDRFGESSVSEFDYEEYRGTGFAEWWDRDLLEQTDKDKLILFCNDDSIQKNDMLTTILHETYPGHGHFYNILAHNKIVRNFDHGAIALIEGWATYVETHAFKFDYTEQIHYNNCALLKLIVESSDKDIVNNILDFKQKQGYTFEEAKRTVTYVMQYPGFIESYYLGEIWIDNFIKSKDITPKQFLEFLLKKQSIGEFFRLWQL